MELVNDKKIKLEKIISEKLIKDKCFNEKIKKTLKKQKIYLILSTIFSIYTIICFVYYFIIIKTEISFLFYIQTMFPITFILLLSLKDKYNIDNLYRETIKYNHDDFIEISNVLSENEMNYFIEKMEKSSTLLSFKQYTEENIEGNIDTSKNKINKDNNRINYIRSLYNKEL